MINLDRYKELTKILSADPKVREKFRKLGLKVMNELAQRSETVTSESILESFEKLASNEDIVNELKDLKVEIGNLKVNTANPNMEDEINGNRKEDS